MSIQQWQTEIDEIRSLASSVQSRYARAALSDALRELKKRIVDEERRVEFEKKNISCLPECFSRYGYPKNNFEHIGDVIYLIDKSGKLDKNGSYNWYHSVWIPQTKIKYAKLVIHTLGKDIYGDRYYLDVDYYKHPADPYPYMNKRIDPFNRTYLPYVHYVLDSLGLKKDEYTQKTRMM